MVIFGGLKNPAYPVNHLKTWGGVPAPGGRIRPGSFKTPERLSGHTIPDTGGR
jgi:hypothetical protein